MIATINVRIPVTLAVMERGLSPILDIYEYEIWSSRASIWANTRVDDAAQSQIAKISLGQKLAREGAHWLIISQVTRHDAYMQDSKDEPNGLLSRQNKIWRKSQLLNGRGSNKPPADCRSDHEFTCCDIVDKRKGPLFSPMRRYLFMPRRKRRFCSCPFGLSRLSRGDLDLKQNEWKTAMTFLLPTL
jgi:hypothetical protein